MNHTRNDRLDQVQEDTLVIGIDIAKFKHYACAVNDRSRELSDAFPFHQSRNGFHHLYDELEQLKKAHQKTNILIGFEPTGHYWMNLAQFLNHHGIPFVLVSPLHVNRAKEFDDNLQTKNDRKDARVIAKMVTQGYFSYPRFLTGVDAELRNGATLRDRLKKDRARVTNQIIRWMDRYFPELHGAFKAMGKTLVCILKYRPLPEEWHDLEVESFLSEIKEKEAIRNPSRKRLHNVQVLASQSIGLTEGNEFARQDIRSLIEQYERTCAELEETKETMRELARQVDAYESLISIPGISEETVCELLAETGPLTNYSHPRQLTKLAGLTLRENSSGQHQGRKRLSKRGRRRLRSLLFRAVLPLIRNNQAFLDLYTYYISRSQNPLQKKDALVVLCSKLLKIFWGLSHHQMAFDAEKMRSDSPPLQKARSSLAS
ncbi:IS110 family transposase [Alkalicoccobacillus plakortidis]|uniref:IS110 family transposase n=1 Tax=Alkalicoccobacillus plakortidis TaxID=444060 RepID=A0ABT0XE59_9BACI|nr:IS110 family transposase [Alkalicoccobacillus plakortidis]MCM2674182.1 IS110 family transposase [Alkalicoccobacillus plakortidis]